MLPKPHWTQGLELGSHHFQLLDRYHEELIAHRLEALFDHTWGIHGIRWDTRAIGAGQLVLRSSTQSCPTERPSRATRAEGGAGPAIPSATSALETRVEVYLGIRRGTRGSNVDTPNWQGSSPPRYVRRACSCRTSSGGQEPIAVEGLRPNVAAPARGAAASGLRDPSVRPDRPRGFRTARLRRGIRAARPGGQRLAVPSPRAPAPRSTRSWPARRSGPNRAPRHDGGRPALAREHRRERLSRALGDIIHQRYVHPLVAYRALAELAGVPGAFHERGHAPIPAFPFDRLGPVFAELFAGLAIVLEAMGADKHRRMPLVAPIPRRSSST